ncbi:peptidoglycan DD-metalloendopeptidase family protein [Microbacterium sp. NPDC091313]
MTHSRPAESASPRRSGYTPDAPADGAATLTRAELRRRLQSTATPALDPTPLTRRQARGRTVVVSADETPAVESLADLAPEALALELPTEMPIVVETAAAAVETTPIALPTSPIVLPARRERVRPAASSPTVELDGEGLARDVHAASIGDAEAEASARTADDVDAFEAAARLFSFTGETPVQVAAAALADDEETTPAVEPRRRGASFRRVATASFSVGVIGVVGLLTVGMTTPSQAVAAAQSTPGTTVSVLAQAGDVEPAEGEIQAYVAPADVQNQTVDRTEDYKTASIAQIAAESGITNHSDFFTNNPNSAIQWPFAVGVPISYGFGMRSGRMHEGLDFVPGAGSPVQAIADGTVRIATESGGAYGVTVVIDHVIDGELVSSRYAHMQYGSLQVKQGQHVTVGTFIGRTGNTGRSFGAHTHFEILMNGTTPIDPLPWLREHAGG